MKRRYGNSKEEDDPSKCSFTSVKALLATGLLEGVSVTYISKKYNAELAGYIKGDGYSCGCTSCNYTEVLNANEFEKHANATTNHPNNHIFLKNGRTLHEVVKHMIKVPQASLYKEMEAVTGCQISSNLRDGRANESSHTTSSEVKEMNHEEKQTKVDNKTREDSVFLFDHNKLQESILHKETVDLFGYRTNSCLSDSSGSGSYDGASESDEISSKDVKQTGIKGYAQQEVSVNFTNQLPLDIRFVHYKTSEDSLIGTPPRIESKRHHQERFKKSFQGKKSELQSFNLSQNVGTEEKRREQVVVNADQDTRRSSKRLKNEVEFLKKGHLDVRTLLATGFLEGLQVKYKKDKVELEGFIKNRGYLCGCSSCKFTQVVSALKFETHAGATSSNQNNYIFLQSGISLYALVKKLVNVPLDSIYEEIEKAIGCAINRCQSDKRTGLLAATSDTCKSSEANQQSEAVELHSDPHLVKSVISPVYDMECNVNQASSINNTVTFPSDTEGTQAISFITQSSSILGKRSDKGIPMERKRSLESNTKGRNSSPSNVRVMFNCPLPNVEENSALHGCLKVSSTWPDKEINSNSDSHMSSVASPTTQKDLMVETLPEKRKRLPVSPKLLDQQKSAIQGSQKKRTGDFHRIIFTENALPDGAELVYRSNGKVILTGYKKDNGIYCNCCNDVVSPSKFEAHAGFSAKRQPYRSIYTSSGISLHEFTKNWMSSHNMNSNCTKCGGEGEMISCDGCSKAFHAECMGLQYGPDADTGSLCLSCKDNIEPGASSKISTSSAAKPVNLDLARVIKRPNKVNCPLCGEHEFDVEKEFGPESHIFCGQCEKCYHIGCLKENKICDLKERPRPWYRWLCSDNCISARKELARWVHNSRGMPIPLPELPRNILKTRIEGKGLKFEDEPKMGWKVLSGMHTTPDNDKLLWKAIAIFQESFGPVTDDGCDVIPVMAAGQQLSKLSFLGMHCVVLIKGSEIVSAALLRLFGLEVAEIPLIATPEECRGKGYFETLLTLLEWFLDAIRVKLIVLPVDEDSEPIWINKFEFDRMAEERVEQYERNHSLVIFEGKTMMEKENSRFFYWAFERLFPVTKDTEGGN